MRLALALALPALTALSGCKKLSVNLLEKPRQTIENFTLSQSFKNQPSWELRSPRATLREDAQKAELETPVIRFFKDGRVSSSLTAMSGVVDMGTYNVSLTTSVVASSLDDGSTLKTEELDYDNKAGKFRTDKDVLVQKPGGTLHGQGLEANKDLSQIRIFKQRSEIQKVPL